MKRRILGTIILLLLVIIEYGYLFSQFGFKRTMITASISMLFLGLFYTGLYLAFGKESKD